MSSSSLEGLTINGVSDVESDVDQNLKGNGHGQLPGGPMGVAERLTGVRRGTDPTVATTVARAPFRMLYWTYRIVTSHFGHGSHIRKTNRVLAMGSPSTPLISSDQAP